MYDFTELQMGYDSIAASGYFSSKEEYIRFQSEVLVYTFKHQPLLIRKMIPVTPVQFDGKTIIEIPTINDIDMPDYQMQAYEKDTKLEGGFVSVRVPQLYLSILLSKDEMKQPFAARQRLALWTRMAAQRIALAEDYVGFRGDPRNGQVGLIGANSYELTTSGKWDVQTHSDGILDKAFEDLQKFISYFEDNGYGDIAINMAMTNLAYRKLAGTLIQLSGKTNIEIWEKAMPDGSEIYHSNTLKDSPDANNQVVVACLGEFGRDRGALQVFASELQMGMEPNGLWSNRFGIREKFAIRVVSNRFCAYMLVDLTT